MLFAIILALLATIKVLLQGYFSKGRVSTIRDSFLLTGHIFLSTAIVMAVLFLRELPTLFTFTFALAMGLSNLFFQLFYTLAMKSGSVSLTVTINQFNFIIPLIMGIIIFNETLFASEIFGIFLMCIALILINRKSSGQQSKMWLLFSLAACFFSSVSNAIYVLFCRYGGGMQKEIFVVCANTTGAVLAYTVAFCLKNKSRKKFSVDKKFLVGMLAIGCILGIHNLVMLIALESGINSAVFYSVMNVLALIFTSVSDLIFFKEKFSKKQLCGIALGIIAVVLINIK